MSGLSRGLGLAMPLVNLHCLQHPAHVWVRGDKICLGEVKTPLSQHLEGTPTALGISAGSGEGKQGTGAAFLGGQQQPALLQIFSSLFPWRQFGTAAMWLGSESGTKALL